MKQTEYRERKDRNERQFDIGFEVIGPIVDWYLYRLDCHLHVLRGQNSRNYFVARAGVRIYDLYCEYLSRRGRLPAEEDNVLWASRLMFVKGFALKAPETANFQLHANFRGKSVRDVVGALVRHEPELLGNVDHNDPGLDAGADQFDVQDLDSVVNPNNRALLQDYFKSYEILLEDYLFDAGHRAGKPFVLVDSGWQGSMHRLAMESLAPSIVQSLYFGALAVGTDIALPRNVIGLILSDRILKPEYAEASIVSYRHLIEGLFEANADSAESLQRVQGRVVCPEARTDVLTAGYRLDSVYLGAKEYLNRSSSIAPAALARKFEEATEILRHLIEFPTKDVVNLLSAEARSADFGRSTEVPIPLDPVDRHEGDTADKRVRDSLWPQAQLLAEFDEPEAYRQMSNYSMSSKEVEYFTHREDVNDGARSQSHDDMGEPAVAIVTRTKDRPILLARAAESVAQQTLHDYEWVIVNDGGDVESVKAVISRCSVDPARITLVNHEESLGMEAASNAGIRSVESQFVVIHDDDDSWSADFLAQMVKFLRDPKNGRYGGVISHTVRVDEVIERSGAREVSQSDYNSQASTIDLPHLLIENLFPPISFLFRRESFDAVGGFDESLPVLGDWDFNIRMLLLSDIGVLPEALANYHHRIDGAQSAYSNSVIGGVSKHMVYRSVLVNRYSRGALGPELAAAVIQAQFFRHTRHVVTANVHRIDRSSATSIEEFDNRWVKLQWAEYLLRSRDSDGVDVGALSCIDDPWLETEFMLGVKPPPDFDEVTYLRENRDVSSAVMAGSFGSGFHHYVLHGRVEGRRRP